MSNHLLNTYARTDFAIERGEGCYVFTKASENRQSERFLDFGAGIAVTSLGHSHPHLVNTLKEQAEKLWHTSNLYQVPGQEKLAKRLCENSFADFAFFTNSGAESNECAIKMARRYHYEKGNENRINILTFEGAFHGRTLATIAAGGQEKYLEGFGPKTQGFIQAEFENWEQTQEMADENCAAIMLEPIQGEGGLRPFSTAFLTKLRKLCDERDILLIFDEIQTGIGRSGQLFAYQNAGVEPDIMALAKGLGGGFPVGACLANEKAASGMKPGIHGTTYGGNPMAMAIGNAVLDVMLEEGFLDQVKRVSGYFSQKLMGLIDSHPTIFEKVMGDGLLTGLKCVTPNLEILQELYKNNMLAVPAGQNVLRILPPLVVTEKEIDEAVAMLDKAATALENKEA